MRAMLARLSRDSWVLGIAAAIAMGYAAVRLVSKLVDLGLGLVEDEETSGRFVFNLGGRDIAYFDVLAATVTFAAVALLAGWLLDRADRQ